MRTVAERTPGRMASAAIPELVLAPPGERREAIERIPGPDPIRSARDRGTGLCRVEIDRVGRFHFQPGAREVRAHPDPGATPATLRSAYLATVLPLALQAAGHQLLHASAVDTPQGVLAFCGPSGAGKSTLAAALARRGHRQWADDAVWWQIETDARGEPTGARTRRLPFQRRLRPDAARWLGPTAESTVGAGAPAEAPAPAPAVVPVRAVYLLSPHGRPPDRRDREPLFEPLRLVKAFPALVDAAYHFPVEERGVRDLAETYLALAVAVPVVRLTPPGDLASLEMVLDRLEERLLPSTGVAFTAPHGSKPPRSNRPDRSLDPGEAPSRR